MMHITKIYCAIDSVIFLLSNEHISRASCALCAASNARLFNSPYQKIFKSGWQ